MSFKLGQRKPAGSGIQKGQRQTKTVVRQQVHEILAKAGKHPVKEIMSLLETADMKPEAKAKIWLELLQYISPKLTATSVSIDDQRDEPQGETIDVTPMSDEELERMAGDE